MPAPYNILVIEARFYDEVSDGLLQGTKAALAAHNYEVITVPGILELPAAMMYAWGRGASPDTGRSFDGVVVLGCAVKGETDHYEHVCRESMSGVQRVALDHRIPVGNGIITAPTWELALNRANPAEGDCGGRAAKACVRLIELARRFGL
jgi:6,7-dimethyl-8-ribityllumazine synthase